MARVIGGLDGKAFNGGEMAPIPLGTKLRVSVFDIKEGVTGPNSKKPGSPQFEFVAKVQEEFEWVDPDKGPQRAKGREIRYNYIPLDPAAGNAWALAQFAEAVGWPTDAKNGSVTVPDDLTEVLGTEFIAKMGHSTGQNGAVFNRVSGYAKIGKGGAGGSKPAASAPKSWGDV